MEKNRVAITILFMIMFQIFAQAQETELFRYIDENSLKDKQSEFSILTSIKNRASSIQVQVIKFSDASLLLTKKSIQVNLPGISALSTNKYIEQHNQTSFTWFGHFDDTEGSMLLVVNDNDVLGMIHISDLVFSIKPLGSGFHALVQIDQSKFPCEQPCIDYGEHNTATGLNETKIQTPETEANITQSLTTLDNSIIDILVVYTPAAASSSGNIFNLINGCISTTNNISSNSDATPQVRLVYSGQADYSESGSLETDVNRLSGSNDGYIDNVHSIRNQYGADLVVLLVASGDNCGYVYDIEVESNGAFAVVRTDCAVDNYSFAHEVGHLVGGRHDTDNSSFPRPYAHGYIKKGNWKTVMAINYPATRIPYWSNPYNIYNGEQMGTVDWNNVTRVWNERGTAVQNFLPTKVLKVPEEYSTISSALIAATSGQVVSVSSGSYSLSSSITVPIDKMLHLNPNVTLSFAPSTSLVVNGTLNANQVTFTRSGTSGSWNGIVFNQGSSGTIQNCNISYASTGIICNYSLPNIINNNIEYNSTGIALYNLGSSSVELTGNTIQNNGYQGIYLSYSSPRIYSNTILNNGSYGISCYNSSPYLYNNLIKNHTSSGLQCNYYSSAYLVPWNSYGYYWGSGNNVIKNNSGRGINAAYWSNLYLGNYPYGGNNSIYSNNSYEVAAFYNSTILAQKNWWGSYPPNDNEFYSYQSPLIDRSSALSSDPNSGMQKILESEENSVMLSKTSASDTELETAYKYQIEGKFNEAIASYNEYINKNPLDPKAAYALVRLNECYRLLQKSGFADYLNNAVNTLKENKELLLVVLELESQYLVSEGRFEEAISKIESIRKEINMNEYVDKYSIFNTGYIYLKYLGDIEKAKEFFAELTKKYPEDELTLESKYFFAEYEGITLPEIIERPKVVIENTPQTFDLLGNYPNPFNPSTTISYTLPYQSSVEIIIYDLIGREIKSFNVSSQSAGYNEFVWDGRNNSGITVTSGVYFYKISIKSLEDNATFVKTSKLIMMK